MADETKINVAIDAPDPVTTAADMKLKAADPNQFRQAFEQRQAETQGVVNSTLDNSLNTQRQGLQNAFNQSMAGQTQATNAGQQAFEIANKDLGIQAGRTQNSMNRYADVRGLNRQPGSQQSLSLGFGSAMASGKLAQQQQGALQESMRQQELLKTNYQNQIAKAVADNDYRRAAALFENYNNQNNWLDANAATMASFGNFTGYEHLYGPETARTMQDFWIGSNPELAYNTGVIDAERYKEITGKYAPDIHNFGGGNDYQWYNPWAVGGMAYGGSAGGGGGGVNGGAGSDTIWVPT